ncbi:NADase-type glycan-binding domain-containing protein [Streptomyces cavernae]|uniref:NADase-type glycan-binding domain-containing protein n=1 Tax=Streptomyces cavernae TaxID=2259034 RepID=UPI0012D89447|nr:zinc ribbon domain-containing protein [Streptomyces cavernae]
MTSQNSGTGREPARSCAECGTRAEPGQSFCDSCGAVLGWSDGPDRSDAARTDPARAEAAAPARDSATGDAGTGGSGDRPGWDAFARPQAGTGTARTGHDPALAGTAGPGGGRRREDEPRWPDARTGGPDFEGTGPSAGRAGDREAAAGWSGARHTDPAPGSGHAGAGQSPAEFGGPGTPPAPRPAHGHPTTVPDSAAAASTGAGAVGAGVAGTGRAGAGAAGAGAAGLRERDTRSPATPASHPSSGFSAGAQGNARPGTQTADTGDTAETEPVPTTAGRGHHPSTNSTGFSGSSGFPDSSDSTAERARSLLIPVSDPEPRAPASPAVAPVLPGRPVANRPQVRAPGPGSGPEGGIPCPWCATPNLPDRHFCGRCAMPMAGNTRTAPGRQPWWRRIPGFGVAQTPWAGDRPRLRRGFGHIMNWVVGALVLALIVTLVLNIGAWVDATRDHFAKRAAVGPDSVKASRSYPGHGAPLAFDKISNTWWGPGVSQSGEGEWLEARFDRPTRLLDLVITSGVSTKADQLSKSALPHRIDARITTADGKTTTRTITLDQSAGGQRRKFRVGDVTAVRFVLRSAYATDAKKQVSIAEIEFFTRSNSNSS